MILSVPEGDDKPIKYPGIFQHAGAQLLNKVDVAPAFDFDMDRYTKTLDDLNPQAPRFAVSARKGEGMDAGAIGSSGRSSKQGRKSAAIRAGVAVEIRDRSLF